MRQCGWLSGVIVLCVLVAPAHGQGQALLEWKFREGDTFFVETVSTLKQNMEVSKRKINQVVEQTAVLAFTVKKVNSDGSVVLEQKIQGMRFKSGVGDVAPDDRFGEKLQGSTLIVTLNAKREVTEIAGYEELVKKLSGDDAVQPNPAQRKLVEEVLSKEMLKKTASEIFTLSPGKAVAKGEKWDKVLGVPLGPLGHLMVRSNFTYEGKDTVDGKPAEKLTFTATSIYESPKAGVGSTLEVSKASLNTEDYKGTLFFDAVAGRLVQSEVKLRLKGSLTMSFQGSAIDALIEQDQTIKTRVLDKNPLAK